MSAPLTPITNDINDYLRMYGNAKFSSAVPAAPGGNVNITWNQDQYGNVAAYVPNNSGAPVTTAQLPTQSTVNTTFAGATTPQQPGLVQTNVEPIEAAGVVTIRPSTTNKTIVILGASVGQGVGATTYANSWAGLLEAGLAGSGYTIRNSSISGNGTSALIARFYTDVAPFRPDIVIICPLTFNDSYDINVWRNHIIQLAKMCRQIGAVPVVAQPCADNGYTLQQFQNVKDVAKELKALGIPVLDYLSATADPTTGHYLAGIFSDALHPNDAGHLVIYNSIPLTMFDQLIYNKQYTNLVSNNTRSWKLISGAASSVPMSLTFDRALTSWTFDQWINIPAVGGANTVLASFTGTGDANGGLLRIRQNSTTGTIALATATANPLFVTSSSPTGWTHFTLVYNSTLNTYTMYLNSVNVGTGTGVGGGSTITSASFLNYGAIPTFPMSGAALGSTYFYRVPLFPEQISELQLGYVHAAGLEWGSNFDTFASSSISVLPTPVNVVLSSNQATMLVAEFDSQ